MPCVNTNFFNFFFFYLTKIYKTQQYRVRKHYRKLYTNQLNVFVTKQLLGTYLLLTSLTRIPRHAAVVERKIRRDR